MANVVSYNKFWCLLILKPNIEKVIIPQIETNDEARKAILTKNPALLGSWPVIMAIVAHTAKKVKTAPDVIRHFKDIYWD